MRIGLILASILFVSILAAEPNPPTWPDSVKIIDPANAAAGQAAIN
jgi:hypothetical protein